MRADRLLQLMLRLNFKGRLTAQQLAAELEVTERTIYRDVQALCAAGVPVNTQSGPSGGIWLDEHYRVSLTGLSQAQIRALFLSSAARPLSDLGFGKALEDTLLKLFAALPDRQRDDVKRLQQRIYIDPADWFQGAEAMPFFAALQRAVWEDWQVDVTYRSGENIVSKGRLDPYALAAKAGQWYLVSRKADGEYHSYRVTRFRAVTLTRTHFDRAPDFDLVSYWHASSQAFERQAIGRTAPYPAVLRIHPSVLWRFTDGANGECEQLGPPDARGWLTLRVTFQSAEEARWCVLGLGAEVRILEPAALDQAAVESAKAILAGHAAHGSASVAV